MRVTNEKWNESFNIDSILPTVIIFKDLNELFNFQKNLNKQIEFGEGNLSIFNYDKEINIEKETEFISNIFSLTLNNRKMINYLHKNIVDKYSKTDYILDFDTLKKIL